MTVFDQVPQGISQIGTMPADGDLRIEKHNKDYDTWLLFFEDTKLGEISSMALATARGYIDWNKMTAGELS